MLNIRVRIEVRIVIGKMLVTTSAGKTVSETAVALNDAVEARAC
jgi:hypothetical protein